MSGALKDFMAMVSLLAFVGVVCIWCGTAMGAI
jgi:hypothetical protein